MTVALDFLPFWLLEDRDTVNGGVNFFSRKALTSSVNLRFLFFFFFCKREKISTVIVRTDVADVLRVK